VEPAPPQHCFHFLGTNSRPQYAPVHPLRTPVVWYVIETIVCKVGRMLIYRTGARAHNFQISSERVQYRLKWHVLGHIRPPSTLQNFQYSAFSL